MERLLKVKKVIGGIVLKAKYFLILSSFVLIFAFQNCQQADMSNGANQKVGAASSDVNAESPLISGQPLNAMTYYYNNSLNKGVTREEAAVASRPNSLQLNLLSGQIQVAGDSQQYCLSSIEIDELKEILKQANVCRVKPSSDLQVCAMVYQSPYAVMHFSNQDVSLGEARSSCEKVDLCDAYPDLVKGFFASVVTNLSSKVCNQ